MAISRPQSRQAAPMIATPPRSASKRKFTWIAAAAPLATIAILLLIWEAFARLAQYPAFILPDPPTAFASLVDNLGNGTLGAAAGTTLQEAGLGFLLAALVAFPLGYLLAHAPRLERAFEPLIAASQAVPVVAVAPLLVTWFGNGALPKVLVCALIALFPMLVSTITGVRGVPREYLEVAQVFGAPRWEQIARVEWPLAAPVLLGGIKLGVALSLTGAVVGEFVASDAGLGFLLTYSRANLDTPLLFATLLTLAALGIALYAAVSYLERIVSRWQG